MMNANGRAVMTPDSDPEEARVIDFAMQWAGCGCGPSDIINRDFGMGSEDFFSRLLAILEDPSPTLLTSAQVTALRAVARWRIQLHRMGDRPPLNAFPGVPQPSDVAPAFPTVMDGIGVQNRTSTAASWGVS
ncbi:hypothetical protein SAMN05445060_2366 [Williamsia sterculiae]|uniref:DUF3263 domain-containing protein n=1 Tax=Williamsia sterculiae TaxID=1344003 RepID=A0A1N7FX25_9NOCA|nr:hypothetical protein SAMN05445060_2366 [Williamsia sterculiae]